MSSRSLFYVTQLSKGPEEKFSFSPSSLAIFSLWLLAAGKIYFRTAFREEKTFCIVAYTSS